MLDLTESQLIDTFIYSYYLEMMNNGFLIDLKTSAKSITIHQALFYIHCYVNFFDVCGRKLIEPEFSFKLWGIYTLDNIREISDMMEVIRPKLKNIPRLLNF